MKLQNLFEENKSFSVFVKGQMTWKGNKLFTVDVTVTKLKDKYGTGDSPRGYEVEINSIFGEDTKTELSFRDIPKWLGDKIYDKAIDKFDY